MDLLIVVLIIAFVIIVLGVLSIDARLKKQLENDERIIARLDILIKIQKDKETSAEYEGRRLESQRNTFNEGDGVPNLIEFEPDRGRERLRIQKTAGNM